MAIIPNSTFVIFKTASPILSVEKPLQPLSSVPGKLQEKLIPMASMSDVPQATQNMIPFRSDHPCIPLRSAILPTKNPF
jgi:hypothetical protein